MKYSEKRIENFTIIENKIKLIVNYKKNSQRLVWCCCSHRYWFVFFRGDKRKEIKTLRTKLNDENLLQHNSKT